MFYKRINKLNSRITERLKRLNKTQKKFLIIFIPILFFMITFPIANVASGDYKFGLTNLDLQDTWFVWTTYLLGVGYIEMKILS